ncbi:SDR family NAD(P)-dependent oxidoreductase [Yinghuangia aomiensis]|uniref:SDR family NAD(P)-dependent oxidoreductase n=1 Tax=Yinghuangia aomiensis TaxID=676205 RepID=A0ABP9I5C3_9ACTN
MRNGKDMRFDGRVAVVTGAGRGLGRAYARLLAERGASLVVNDLGVTTHGTDAGEDRAAAVVAEIEAVGGTAVPDRSSVATAEGGEAIIATAVEAFGRVDIVVNNAGPKGGGAFGELPEVAIDAMLQAHLRGAFFVTRPAWRRMRQQGYGRIVMTASQAVFGEPRTAHYAAAKAGVIGLTNALAAEAGDSGIQVNAVLPTARTPGNDAIPNETFKAWLDQFRPEHVAPLVAFLAHESCPWNGEKFIAGGGRVSRLFLASTRGAFVPGLTMEDVAAAVETITDERGYAVSRTAMEDMALWTEYFPWPDSSGEVSMF